MLKLIGEGKVMKKMFQFLKEAKAELKKVSWPSWDDVTRSTTVVFISVIIFTIFIYLTDKAISMLIEGLLSGGAKGTVIFLVRLAGAG